MAKDRKDELIDSHVSISLCKKAIAALVKHATEIAKRKEETELLPGKEENVWLVLSVKKVTPEKKLKPFKIPLAHPIVDPRTNPICLITKDPQREYKDLLESHNIKFINRVVGVSKLKGKFKPFEARRMLLKENGLFFADERVVPLLPALLGKMFFNAKKQPIPVSLTKKDLRKELEQAVSSTYMHQNQGTCTSIKIGVVSQTPEHILENLKLAFPEIVKRINGEWDNIQSFHIKTNSSVSLPIWTCQLGDGENGRWTELKNDNTVEGLTSEDHAVNDEPVEKTKTKSGKKRAPVGDDRSSSKKSKTSIESRVELSDEENDKLVSKPRKQQSLTKPSIGEHPIGAKEKEEKQYKNSGIDLDTSTGITRKPSSKASSSTKSSKESSLETKSASEKPVPKTSSPPVKPTRTKDEITKKRVLRDGLEKKKEKLAKKRLGGGMKESIVGKKAKSRV